MRGLRGGGRSPPTKMFVESSDVLLGILNWYWDLELNATILEKQAPHMA